MNADILNKFTASSRNEYYYYYYSFIAHNLLMSLSKLVNSLLGSPFMIQGKRLNKGVMRQSPYMGALQTFWQPIVLYRKDSSFVPKSPGKHYDRTSLLSLLTDINIEHKAQWIAKSFFQKGHIYSDLGVFGTPWICMGFRADIPQSAGHVRVMDDPAWYHLGAPLTQGQHTQTLIEGRCFKGR